MALLRAIIRKPAVLLLDEPTSALDHASTLAVETLLTELAAAGTGLVVVSHNEQQAERIATRRVQMTRGILTNLEIRA
jgi:putative ABC transport system ATP-binding protein